MTLTTPIPTDPAQAQPPERRSAILFISGLGTSEANPSAEGIASRIAHALNRGATERRATYAVLPGANEVNLRADVSLARATVQRSAPDEPSIGLDVWLLATAEELVADYEDSKLYVKVLRGARVVARYGRKAQIIFRKGRPAKRALERAQLWVVRALIVLLGLYLAALLIAFLGEVSAMDWVPKWASGAVLGLTGLGIWQSKRIKLLTAAAVQLHCLLDYIGEGESVGAFRAHVADTLEHLAEQKDVIYDQVDVIAYSFGSVVALDAFFPRADKPGPGFANVDTMVTIGCPYDLLRTYWPGYYTNRHRLADAPTRWINVYSPRDVFGSNFVANDGTNVGIDLQTESSLTRPDENFEWVTVAADGNDIQVWQILGFPGLKAHGIYWHRERDHDESVFSKVVRELYTGKALLA